MEKDFYFLFGQQDKREEFSVIADNHFRFYRLKVKFT